MGAPPRHSHRSSQARASTPITAARPAGRWRPCARIAGEVVVSPYCQLVCPLDSLLSSSRR
eukprot:scaffold93127_cov25-Tisochrysis_lutea.AAC.2